MAEENELKWNWMELVKIKEEKKEYVQPTIQQSTYAAPKAKKNSTSKAVGVQKIKLTAEQKRAASFAKYGVGPKQTEPRKKQAEMEYDFTADPDPRMTKDKFAIYVPSSNSAKSKDPVDPNTLEKYSGLRIKDRVVSAEEMDEQMQGRKFYKLADLEDATMRELENKEIDWVTIAVVTKKTISKAEHSPFVVWTLSDLANSMISVFLYQGAYEEHWKLMEGSVVALVNPSVMPAKEQGKFALKVSGGFHVVKLGSSIDFGMCKSLTKGGAQCKIAINTSNGDYCVIHMAAKFKEAGKGRQALNSASTFRADLFRDGDSVRNISAGSYVHNTKSKPVTKRKRSDVFMGVATQVDSQGNVQLPEKIATSKQSTVTTPIARKDPQESIAELRQMIATKKTGQTQSNQSLVAKLLGVGGPAKKMNLMQVIQKTSEAPAPSSTRQSPSSLMATLNKPATTLPSTLKIPRTTNAPRSLPNTSNMSDRARQVTSLRASGMFAE